jgi:hypothetical protein
VAYKNPGKSSVEMHTGPEGSCAVVETITSNSLKLYLDCEVVNSAGNYWEHLVDPKTGDEGWVYAIYLTNGALFDC